VTALLLQHVDIAGLSAVACPLTSCQVTLVLSKKKKGSSNNVEFNEQSYVIITNISELLVV
jgi:hypothetical protein